jgi:hypothetical protein
VGGRAEVTAAQLEVALLDRGRAHQAQRAFRRLTGARLEGLLSEAVAGREKTEAIAGEGAGEAAPPPGDNPANDANDAKGPDGAQTAE